MESFTAFIPINRCPLTCPWTPPVPSVYLLFCKKWTLTFLWVQIIVFFEGEWHLPPGVGSKSNFQMMTNKERAKEMPFCTNGAAERFSEKFIISIINPASVWSCQARAPNPLDLTPNQLRSRSKLKYLYVYLVTFNPVLFMSLFGHALFN